jgi:hypothetical protein
MAPRDRLAAELVSAGGDALAPGLGVLGGRLARLVQDEWAKNTSRALREAERISGLSREDLEELLISHPEAVPLLQQVLYAAGTNGHDRTLRAMGAGLGLAAQAAGRRDDHALADIEGSLRAIREFDYRHFAVLDHLAPLQVELDEIGIPDYEPFSTSSVSAATGLSESSAMSCCLALAGAGLLREAPAKTTRLRAGSDVPDVYDHGGGWSYLVTDLGSAIWKAAQHVVPQRTSPKA